MQSLVSVKGDKLTRVFELTDYPVLIWIVYARRCPHLLRLLLELQYWNDTDFWDVFEGIGIRRLVYYNCPFSEDETKVWLWNEVSRTWRVRWLSNGWRSRRGGIRVADLGFFLLLLYEKKPQKTINIKSHLFEEYVQRFDQSLYQRHLIKIVSVFRQRFNRPYILLCDLIGVGMSRFIYYSSWGSKFRSTKVSRPRNEKVAFQVQIFWTEKRRLVTKMQTSRDVFSRRKTGFLVV